MKQNRIKTRNKKGTENMSEHGGQKKAKKESNEYKLFEMFAQNKVY